LNHEGKTVIISTHDVELVYPWADRAILLLDGQILEEDRPEAAFGNIHHVRQAHLSVPTLLDLSMELSHRGYAMPERKPQSVLDMVEIIEHMLHGSTRNRKCGTISVFNVDELQDVPVSSTLSLKGDFAIGTMGTRAKQRAHDEHLDVEFTYGVIDKCILRALRGLDSLIVTTESMAGRVSARVEDYCRESESIIEVVSVQAPGIEPPAAFIERDDTGDA
jgi:cobalt/nickel transport system ATP-binding protein